MYVGGNRAQAWNQSRFEAAGLGSDGQTWLVVSGDNPSKIAKTVTGDESRWRELIKANPTRPTDPTTGNFKNIWPGETLNLPASWVKQPSVAPVLTLPTVQVQAPVASLPAVAVVPPPPPAAASGGATSVSYSPSGMSSADIVHAKGLLLSWATFAGNNSQGLTDYGARPEDVTPVWTQRDAYEASVFEGMPSSSGIQLTAGLLKDLDDWAASHMSGAGGAAAASSGSSWSGGATVTPVSYTPGSASPVSASPVSAHASMSMVGAKASGGGGGLLIVALGVVALAASRKGSFRLRRR